MACNFNYLVENQYFLKSQPATNTVNVVISWKRCQIVSLLLQTTNRKWYITYRIEAILMTLSHLQGHSYCNRFQCDVYALDAMLVRCLLSSWVRPQSVRPFVTSRCTTETTKCRISETPQQDSPETPVLRRKRCLGNSDEIILNGDAKLRLLTGREVFGSDLPPTVCVHPPRWSASTKVRWRRKTRCHQQLWW